MIHDMSINADQIRSLREARGWSQEHLAEGAGLSLRTIQRVEAEGRGSRETKLSLAAAFDVPLGRLCAARSVAGGQAGGAETVGLSLTVVGTVLVVAGLISGLNAGILVSAAAILVGALSAHGLEYLNGMRRAAGLPPLVKSPAARAGLVLLVTGLAVIVLGFSVSGQGWWFVGGFLAAFGLLNMLWPLLTRRLTGGGGPAASGSPRDSGPESS